jgi:hypothetical protein
MLDPSEEEIKQALEIIKNRSLARRNDSFDIGEEIVNVEPQSDNVINIIQNPSKLADMLGLSERQAENVSAIITGGVAGASSKFLSKYIGEELAGAIGGFLGGYVSKRAVKGK